jgi:hypothetical protein
MRGFINFQADGDLISATVLNDSTCRLSREVLVLVKDGSEFAVANYVDDESDLTDPEWFCDLTEAAAVYAAKLNYYFG